MYMHENIMYIHKHIRHVHEDKMNVHEHVMNVLENIMYIHEEKRHVCLCLILLLVITCIAKDILYMHDHLMYIYMKKNACML